MDSHIDIEVTNATVATEDNMLDTNNLPLEENELDFHQTENAPQSEAMPLEANEPFEEEPPLTSALEALLGGLDATVPTADLEDVPSISKPAGNADTIVDEVQPMPNISGLLSETTTSMLGPVKTQVIAPQFKSTISETEIAQDAAEGQKELEHPEWEEDSSPIESSSNSSDDSSDESEDGENTYKLLSPEEQARILMQDGGSDDEGDSKSKGPGTQLRTKNEIAEVVIEKPDVTITENMPVCELGTVDGIVENTVLIKAKTSGEYKVLEGGSVLCLPDRIVIGAICETIGRVQQPYYSVLFTNDAAIKEAGLEIGTKVFYSEQHSTYVFTKALRAYKGSDASNLHDEEVGDDEMEFSDDEAEAAHKQRVKQKRIEKRGGTNQQNGGSKRGGYSLQQYHTPPNASKGLNYDDNDDGPYRPLARPAGYANTVGQTEAPEEGPYQGNQDRPQSRENFNGRGDRGDRDRGGGDRGRGRGRGAGGSGFHERSRNNNGHSHPPQVERNFQSPQAHGGRGGFQARPEHNNWQSAPSQAQQNYPSPQTQGAFQQPAYQQYQQPSYNPQGMPSNFFPQQQYSPNQPQMPAWQTLMQQQFQNQWPNMPLPPPIPGLPGGAYINPAFFNSQQQRHPGNPNPLNQQLKKP